MKYKLVNNKRAEELIKIEFSDYCRSEIPGLTEEELKKRVQEFHELLNAYLTYKTKYTSQFSTEFTFSEVVRYCLTKLNCKFETELEMLDATKYIFEECFDEYESL